MNWKNILKREKPPLVPDEARFNIPTGNLNNPPESRYFENAQVHWMESVKFVGEELEKRYIPTKQHLEAIKKPYRIKYNERLRSSQPENLFDFHATLSDEQVESRRKAATAAYRVAEEAIRKVIDPYMEFLGSWDKKKNLQEANKEWEYLTHRVMLTVHTALNNLFPTVEDAYRSRKLNGFLHWKGEYYQNLMNKKLPDTMEQIKPAKKQPSKKEPPKKRDYMAERKERIERLRRDRK
tara:strand:- start:670 stop:1383 length:714 start_codon:yes stop_codon:yes gene_type:complete